MAKQQDFMSKTMKSMKKDSICPTCETAITYMRVVRTEKSQKTDAWRFSQGHVGVCKCNEKEVYA